MKKPSFCQKKSKKPPPSEKTDSGRERIWRGIWRKIPPFLFPWDCLHFIYVPALSAVRSFCSKKTPGINGTRQHGKMETKAKVGKGKNRPQGRFLQPFLPYLYCWACPVSSSLLLVLLPFLSPFFLRRRGCGVGAAAVGPLTGDPCRLKKLFK